MTDTGYHTEQELLLSVAKGNQQAFTLVVREYWQPVYVNALSYLHSPQQAEELTQDVFVKLWEIRTQLPLLDNFRGYLFIMARNMIISALRKKLDHYVVDILDDMQQVLLDPGLALELKEMHAFIVKGIGLLPPRRRQVFQMSRIDGKTHAAIASELGISMDTVNEHIVLAVNSLRIYLGAQFNTGRSADVKKLIAYLPLFL